MGKKNQQVLGKSIIRQRAKNGAKIKHLDSWRHCSELDSGTQGHVQSITEQTDLDDFLATAELAGAEFAAEKLNATVVTSWRNEGLLSYEETAAIKQAQNEHQHFLRIPRRPEWDEKMTAAELDEREKESFLEWRRQLAQVQEKEHIILTPFERNIDFWRQLWRVIERSDVVVQIVDARNPLLFRCEDLESYVTEVAANKCNLLLLNKADFLTEEQRHSWAQYFKSIEVPVAFWSAQQENERLTALRNVDENTAQELEGREIEDTNEEEENSDEQNGTLTSRLPMETVGEITKGSPHEQEQIPLDKMNSLLESHLHVSSTQKGDKPCSSTTNDCDSCAQATNDKTVGKKTDKVCGNDDSCEQSDEDDVAQNSTEISIQTGDEFSGRLLTRDELLALFKMLHLKKCYKADDNPQPLLTTVGLVGYPNVGKSSTINTLLNDKKVAVSVTPGRTKHFQTLYVNNEILLCDCPGLVFPSFVSTKADMILNGILPIDQIRDHVPPVSLLCQRIPRNILEAVYGISIAQPSEEEEPDRAPFADELLSAYGYMRGFMTSHGIPDGSRSARYILKDYVKGKLLYCIAPPGEDEPLFQQMGHKLQKLIEFENKKSKGKDKAPKQVNEVDKDFFKQQHVRVFTRGILRGPMALGGDGGEATSETAVPYKPWKKHHNKNKREKLRRLVKKHS